MQFHLNGFRPGDPEVFDPVPRRAGGDGAAPREVDVLIVGCGPAGLTLAAQLAAFPDLDVAIVEQKPGPLQRGQADGISVRTMETFEALGFSERVLKEAYWVNETTFWKPDDARRDRIVRSARIQDVEDGLSEFPHVILNQARIHDMLLEIMRRSPSRLEPLYARRLVDVTVDENAASDDAAYPVTATLDHDGTTETIRARYVVGCDGARSAVRRAIGLALQGESANQAWGVMDVLAVTDFPDIRFKTLITSANDGTLGIIPREGGYMVRLYIHLFALEPGERIADRNVTTDTLIATAKRVFHPYTIDVKEIPWWSVYEIGQRLCDRFDDVPDGAPQARRPRVFIAGDACHTHSPKAGQGMNVSIADAFNLGWKLAAVLRGAAAPQLLHTYSGERRALAKELIDFDREIAGMMSATPKDPSDPSAEGLDHDEFQRYFAKHLRYTAGTAAHYAPSPITAEARHQHLATGFTLGMRFHSAPVIRLADTKRVQLGHTVKADGRWRLFAFAGAGAPFAEDSPLLRLCAFLAGDPASPVRRSTPPGADPDAVIDVRAVVQQHHRELGVEDVPPFLLPQKGRYGLRDYEKVFCADLKSGEDVFAMRGIDRERGCVVVVRPDQFVANVLPLDAFAELAAFFDPFMGRVREGGLAAAVGR